MINKSSNEYKAGFRAGATLVGAYNKSDISPMAKIAAVKEYESDLSVQKLMCKAAKVILAAGGESESAEYKLYDVIDSFDSPMTKYSCQRFINPVIGVLCDEARREAGVVGIDKSAAILPGIASIFGKALGTGNNVLQNLLMFGGITGASLGGLTWYLNRAAKENDYKAEAKEEQAAHYRRIAKDLKKRIQLERDSENENLERVVNEESPDAYVV